jgi:hypothetical protein
LADTSKEKSTLLRIKRILLEIHVADCGELTLEVKTGIQ